MQDNKVKHIWFDTDGRTIHAQHWESGDRFSLIFIHGAIANGYWWSHIADSISGGKIWSIDLSGHGDSDWAAPYTLDKHADEVVSLIKAYAAGPIYVVGHSYGGAVAALVATRVSLEKVVMVDTPLSMLWERSSPANKQYKKHVYGSLEEAVRRFKPIPHQPIKDEKLLSWIAKRSIVAVEGGYTWKFDPSFHQRVIEESSLHNISFVMDKICYWYGEHSPFIDQRALNKIQQQGVEALCIKGAYHAVMMDAPNELVLYIQNLCA